MLKLQKFGINIFEEFGKYNYTQNQKTLPDHRHKNGLEICFLETGCQEYFIETEKFTIQGGDLFITYPNEQHGTGGTTENKGKLFWMILKRPEKREDYLGLSYNYAKELFYQLLIIKDRKFKSSKQTILLFKQIYQLYNEKSSPFIQLKMRNLIISLFIDIIAQSKKVHQEGYDLKINKIINYIHQNLYKSIKLDTLADLSCLSLSHFKHLFKQEVGMPPLEYIQREKIERAKVLIQKTDFDIKYIAYDLGFSSPSYFTVVFKQYNNMSPLEYKNNLENLK